MSRRRPISGRSGRRRAPRWAPAVGLIATIFSATALAQPAEPAAEPSKRGVAAEAGYERIAGDSFLGLRLKFGYALDLPQVGCDEGADTPAEACQTELRLVLQAPLRLRLSQADPAQSGLLRSEDWDEASDYLRILRTLEYGRPDQALHAHLGELGPVSLGHGTVVRNYYNVITTDHYQMGAAADLNTVYGGVELLLDNVIDPGVMGGRVFVNPWAFVDPESPLSRIGIGATVVADIQAPTRLHIVPGTPQGGANVAVDDTLNPVVDARQTTSLVGVDVEFSLVDTATFGLVPYTDFTSHSSLGSGFYTGAFLSARPSDSLELISQLEYRRLGERFLPTYFGPIYEIERLQFVGWGQQMPAPKVRAAASLTGEAAQGFYGSLSARMAGLFGVTAAFADHQGPANSLAHLQASVTPTDSVQVGVFYHKQYFDRLSDLTNLDGALVAAESRVGVWGPIYALGRYGRMWKIDPEGRYQTVDDWSLGLGASMGF